jgi:tetratricopeptide (TPR) repeat protein
MIEPGKISKQVLLFMLLLLSGSCFHPVLSQNVQTKPTRQSSTAAFTKGDYEKAYSDFKELLIIYPKDPLYKYYSGVCLVKLNRNSINAESYLRDALQSSSSSVKTLPSDALFYLGRAQQMSGKFSEATESYNQYTQLVGKKTAKDMAVPDFIEQCNDKKGKTDVIKSDQAAEIEAEAVSPSQVVEDTIKNKIPARFEKLLDEALIFQGKADSLNALATNQKKQLDKLAPSEKKALKAKITEYEVAAASYQKSADQKYNEAQAAMNPQITISDDSVSVIKPAPVEVVDSKAPAAVAAIVSGAEASDNKKNIATDNQPGKAPKPSVATNKPVEVFSVFTVLDKPVTGPKEKIVIDPVVPDGLIYRIQIAVFRNPVVPSYFKGITPVHGFKLTGTDKTNYYAGMFRRSADASRALTKVKAIGFKDAFVVALSNKKAVSSDRAAALEKEWGKKPLMTISDNISEISADTVPPTLTFRVEVMRSVKPVKDDVLQAITKMAGSRGLDNQITDDGKIAYLVGKFITFESAAEYADLLVRNGYRDSRVVAWLGKKEIPLETAKKLFDDLK